MPKGASNQKVRDAKGYEHHEVRGPRGTKDRRGAWSKRCRLLQILSDPYGSVYDLLNQNTNLLIFFMIILVFLIIQIDRDLLFSMFNQLIVNTNLKLTFLILHE